MIEIAFWYRRIGLAAVGSTGRPEAGRNGRTAWRVEEAAPGRALDKGQGGRGAIFV
jgi:hypothetical protein